jgi:hypothetical protein
MCALRALNLTAETMLLMTVVLLAEIRALQVPWNPARTGISVATVLGESNRYRIDDRQSIARLQLVSTSSLGESEVIYGAGVNGDHLLEKLQDLDSLVAQTTCDADELLPEAPPMSYNKFLTMQEKRAVVTIRYSGEAGLKPYFLTMAKKIKASHPDVIVERRILPAVADGEATFEVLVDGKVVIGKSRHRKVGRGVEMPQHARRSVFVSMSELDLAIARARRKQRPTTAYGSVIDETKGKPKRWLDK